MDNNDIKPTSDITTPNAPETIATATSSPTDNIVSQATPAPSSYTSPAEVLSTPPKPGKKKLFGKLGLIPTVLVISALLFGSGAAAYFGVIVPNKPENVLKTAIENTARQTKSKFDGKFNFESTDPSATVKAVNINFRGQGDSEQSAFQTEFDITASGVSLPFEVRSVEKSIYVKVGDLSTIKSLAMAASPEYGGLIDLANEKLANQWIEIDETLLKQAEADCALNTSYALTDEDIDLLTKRYQEVPFTTVKSTSSEEIDGRDTYKYEIDLDDNKAAEYAKGLEGLSIVQKLKECSDEEDDPLDTEELADDDITPLTLWVDKGSKTIRRFVMNSTKQDEEKSNFKGSFEINFTFGEAEVTKPENSKPAMEVIADLQALFMSQSGAGYSLGEQTLDYSNLGDFDF